MALSQAQKKPAPHQDWHPADVIAALRKAGWSLTQLGLANGYLVGKSIGNALRTPYPRAEQIIAAAIGVEPQTIWPSRYDSDGNSNRPRGRSPMRPPHATGNGSTQRAPVNPQRAASR